MAEEVTLEFDFAVTDDVQLSVIIGDGQIGGSSVTLDGEPVGKPGTIRNCRIGSATHLSGKRLLVKTLVSDVSDDTDWTSVTYVLTGGEPNSPFTARHKVGANGNGVVYRTTFVFDKGE